MLPVYAQSPAPRASSPRRRPVALSTSSFTSVKGTELKLSESGGYRLDSPSARAFLGGLAAFP